VLVCQLSGVFFLHAIWGCDSNWTKNNVKPVRNRTVSLGRRVPRRVGGVGFLLSEVDLPRFGMLDPRIIRSLARVEPPITSIIGTSRSLMCVRHILLEFSGGKTPPLARYAVDYFAVETFFVIQ
jgi:hypothetical protein